MELTKEQKLAINQFKRSVKRVNNCGLKIMMQDSWVTIHFKEHCDKYEFDHGWIGMKDENGMIIPAIDAFGGIEH